MSPKRTITFNDAAWHFPHHPIMVYISRFKKEPDCPALAFLAEHEKIEDTRIERFFFKRYVMTTTYVSEGVHQYCITDRATKNESLVFNTK